MTREASRCSAICWYAALLAGTALLPDALSQQPVKKDRTGHPTITNRLGMKLVFIPKGDFQMGSEETHSEMPLHQVRLTKDFYLEAHILTVRQFRVFVKETGYMTETEKNGKGCLGFDLAARDFVVKPEYGWRNPGFAQANDHPVVCVSWNDAQAFCKWLSQKNGKTYRLPTEAEMEFAQRAGTTTRFPTGEDDAGMEGFTNLADQSLRAVMGEKIVTLNEIPKGNRSPNVAPWDDGYPFTSPVGKFTPNPWGLYDMNGNVWTWVNDWGGKYEPGPQVDPAGPAGPDNGTRAMRGGNWYVGPWRARSNARMRRPPDESFSYIGIRVARSVE